MKSRGRNVVIEGASMLVCPECASKFGHSSSESTKKSTSQPRHRASWLGGSPEPQTAPRTLLVSVLIIWNSSKTLQRLFDLHDRKRT